MKIDELDKKILQLLVRDGRMSSAEIARTVDAPERTVNYRINTLIQRDVLSIVGHINRRFFGYEVMGDIFCNIEGADPEEVARQISRFPEVSYVTISFGSRDISLQVFSKSNTELYEFVTKKLLKIPGVTNTTTVIVPHVVKDVFQWFPPELMTPEESTAQEEDTAVPSS
jgi:Lrp/AsnC family leucine-responsive transcriptional regulator